MKAGTFLLGMTLCVNIGSILTPWKNIIISTHFNLTSLFYIQNLWFISFILLFSTIFVIDYFMFSKESDIDKKQIKLVLEFINAEVIIENRKMFYVNSIALILTFILLIFLPFIYLTAAFSALLLVLFNQKFHKNQIKEIFKNIEWEFIFFFIASYVIIGCLLEAGFREIFNLIQFNQFSNFLILIILTILVVIVISFLPDTPTALLFIPIVEVLIYNNNFPMVPILITFLLAFNIGGNLLPQGSSADMLTLELADKYHVDNLNFKRLLKIGALITLFHLGLIIGYVSIFSLFFH
jgi:Na+/H+ antiporter NhaD/arsenite permease-like protein